MQRMTRLAFLFTTYTRNLQRAAVAGAALTSTILLLTAAAAHAQGLGAGTIEGTLTDPTSAVMQAVEVRVSNPVS
jgi:hypothetical protein